jgi:hypothetical protein
LFPVVEQAAGLLESALPCECHREYPQTEILAATEELSKAMRAIESSRGN